MIRGPGAIAFGGSFVVLLGLGYVSFYAVIFCVKWYCVGFDAALAGLGL